MEKLIRYTKQRRVADCVPVALMNILKWSGKKFDYNYAYKPFKELLGTDYSGTCQKKELSMMRILDLAGFPIHVKRKINLADVDQAIKQECILSVCSCLNWYSDPFLHVYLVVGANSEEIQLVNAHGSRAVQWMPRKDFKTVYLQRVGKFPNGFVIGKPN